MARMKVIALEPVAERLGGPEKDRVEFQEEVSEGETLESLEAFCQAWPGGWTT